VTSVRRLRCQIGWVLVQRRVTLLRVESLNLRWIIQLKNQHFSHSFSPLLVEEGIWHSSSACLSLLYAFVLVCSTSHLFYDCLCDILQNGVQVWSNLSFVFGRLDLDVVHFAKGSSGREARCFWLPLSTNVGTWVMSTIINVSSKAEHHQPPERATLKVNIKVERKDKEQVSFRWNPQEFFHLIRFIFSSSIPFSLSPDSSWIGHEASSPISQSSLCYLQEQVSNLIRWQSFRELCYHLVEYEFLDSLILQSLLLWGRKERREM